MVAIKYPFEPVPVTPLPTAFRDTLSDIRGSALTDEEWDELTFSYDWHVGIEAGPMLERPRKVRERNRHATKIRKASERRAKNPELSGGYYDPIVFREPSMLTIGFVIDDLLNRIKVPATDQRRLATVGILHHARTDVVKSLGRPVRKQEWSRPLFMRYERYLKHESEIADTETRYLELKVIEREHGGMGTMMPAALFEELTLLEEPREEQRKRLGIIASEFRNLFRRKGLKNRA